MTNWRLTMIEEWKDIKGYEGLYQVSNLGRVKSLKFGKERILKTGVDRYGYISVNLYKNNKRKLCKVHRLVAQAFIPNHENKPQVNHIDEDKTNNMVSNLEWVTAKENVNHGTRNDRVSKAVKVIDIANGEYNYYNSINECVRQLGLHQGNVVSCLKGRRKTCGGYTFKYKEVD
ncbi:HNH endonuclease family protein [Enterococcus phage EFRM31]|uniref:HNH endonuclease n=1 Tax=Enterococcus phage EFRM31 TaxID=767806 RepID=UPI0001D9923E|nr:HNH endonuclease [Enterococcus phage EFRM31]ADI23905.1 HNH endonuclease family protein [Enterococcus phage EFRM31]